MADAPQVPENTPVAVEEEQSPAPLPAADLTDVAQLWEQAVSQVEAERPSVAAFLKKCQPVSATGEQLDIGVGGNKFTFKSVAKHLDFIEDVCSKICGRKVKINLTANAEDEEQKQQARETADRLKKKALSHPLVMETLELFSGKIVDIKVP